MEDRVMTCLTCHVAFADLNQGREHYKSEWHRYNTKRKVAQMEPLSAAAFKAQMAAKQEKSAKEKESDNGFCIVCNKAFRSKKALDSHLRSKKHREMEAIAERSGLDKSQLVTRSTSKTSDQTEMEAQTDEDIDVDSDEESWDEDGEVLGLEECLFCSHISSSLEANLEHMTIKHSFFLPDAEFICDLEGLVVYLGELISQGHMCLWCQERSKLFRSIRDVQKHMVDKGHCKMRHDESTSGNFADYYDYTSSYPDAEGDNNSVDPEMLISSGFELALPTGHTIGHRSLATYYKQNMGGRRQLVRAKTPINNVLASYKALGWTGTTGAAAKQHVRDVQHSQRSEKKFHVHVALKANKMQFHYREQNPK